MMSNLYIVLALRWVHILCAVAMLGGSFFLRWSVLPAMSELAEDQRRALQQGIRQRWARVVGLASGLLLVSGLVNAVGNIVTYKFVGPLAGAYHALVAVKLLLALGVFALAAMLTGRSAAAERIRANQAFWLNIVIVMGVALVCLGGVMKVVERLPK
ncbi:MAG: hypothetical protein O2931_17840 [Planctomycetota bacterium]|nr:hypothetical protein [Planctomycetota bacterium]MDA1180643.1 hypothetical protein [Planctomycetota bacterium]